jgi:hypothetical protein
MPAQLITDLLAVLDKLSGGTPASGRLTQGVALANLGLSRRTAQEQGSRLLSNVMVRREIDRLMAARSERVEIDADEVMRRFDCLYYEALATDDLATAARCAESLAKCVGACESHNRQKRRGPGTTSA